MFRRFFVRGKSAAASLAMSKQGSSHRRTATTSGDMASEQEKDLCGAELSVCFKSGAQKRLDVWEP